MTLRLGGATCIIDRKSTRLNSSHTEIYTLSLHDALPISYPHRGNENHPITLCKILEGVMHTDDFTLGWRNVYNRSEEHTSELQSHRDLHSFPTRRSSDLLSP